MGKARIPMLSINYTLIIERYLEKTTAQNYELALVGSNLVEIR
jgi:hypothetical protein